MFQRCRGDPWASKPRALCLNISKEQLKRLVYVWTLSTHKGVLGVEVKREEALH